LARQSVGFLTEAYRHEEAASGTAGWRKTIADLSAELGTMIRNVSIMNRSWDILLSLLVLSPLVCTANELVIPEVAIEFKNLPASTAGSEIYRRNTATDAVTPIGSVILSVRREDAEVPSGSSLSDSSFRATVQSRFDKELDPKAQGALTSVGGHAGWALIEAQRSARSPWILYTCVIYVIVDQHLYRLMVRTVGGVQRPTEFDAVVREISNAIFLPAPPAVDGTPGPVAAAGPMKLPPFAPVGGLGDGLIVGLPKQTSVGVADLEFTIDGQGRAQGYKVLYTEPRQYGVLALTYLQQKTFGVPADWEESGSQSLRFTVEFQFPVATGGSCPGPGLPPHMADTPVIPICLAN
jgi:hypothetical protein